MILILTTARTIEHACLSNCKQHRIWPWWNPGSMQAVDFLADPCSSHPPALEAGWKNAAYVQCRCGRREPKAGEKGFVASRLAGWLAGRAWK
jgi:hypothetical protein